MRSFSTYALHAYVFVQNMSLHAPGRGIAYVLDFVQLAAELTLTNAGRG